MRVYVIYGQGGIVTSFGMFLLAKRIRAAFPKATVTTHGWDNPQAIGADIGQQKLITPIALIGYSLGANCVTWAASTTETSIDLAVCYDPSVLSIVKNPNKNVKRLLLYHNTDIEPEGHAVFKGPQVEVTEIKLPHLAICYNAALHDRTMVALSHVNPEPT